MKIFWQSFVDRKIGASYLDRLERYLNQIAAPGTEVSVFGMSPPDRDFGRLSELRCGLQAIDAALGAEEAGYDCFVMGHFQDPCLYDIRSALRIPVIGTGEATLLAASQLGRRIGLISLDPAFETMHYEQANLYGLGDRVKFVAGLGLTPGDFDQAFSGDAAKKAVLLDGFTAAAMPMVEAGADVIVPAGVLPGLLIGGEPGFCVGHAPVINCAAAALKSAEMWVQLHALSNLEPSRGPSFKLANDRARKDFRTLMRAELRLSMRFKETEKTMTATPRVVYTATVTATGGRDGKVRSDDGYLDVKLTMPKEFGGPGGEGTNPEQLFAAGYSACFLSATKLAARLAKVALPEDPTIDARVSVLSGEDGYRLTTELRISIPGIERDVAERLVADAHQRCPFSKATRGNMDVTLTIVE